MPVKIDYVLENAAGTDQAMENHKEIIITRGDGQKKRDKLKAGISNLTSLNKAQLKAENTVEQKTKEQDRLMDFASSAVTQVQNAAKSAAKDNDISLKVFKIGTDKPKSVKAMTTLLDYLSDVVVEYHDMLIANGMTEEDIANISTLYVSLVAANAAQENAMKIRNAATDRRDEAAGALQQTISGIREYAKTVFKGDKATLEEFKPIPMGRGKSATKPPTTTAAAPTK